MKTYKAMTAAIVTLVMIAHATMMAATNTTIRIYKENAGENGYSDVRESHTTDFSGNQDHTLECYNPGGKKCKWQSTPAGRLIAYAESQILSGFLVGTYQEVFNNVLYRVQWVSTGNTVEIQETQEDAISVN